MSFTIRFVRAEAPPLESLSDALGTAVRWVGGSAPRAAEAGRFFEDGRSTRGVEFLWLRGYGVVRVPTLGNAVDHRLALALVRALRDPGSPIRTDAGEFAAAAFDAAHTERWIQSRVDEDVALVRERAALEPIAVVGPRRVAYIGARLLGTLPPGSEALLEAILRVQYPSPDEDDRFQAGVVRMATSEGAAVRTSSWAPGVRYLVGPVDVLMLLGDPPVHIAAYDAIRIAPEHVRLLDERHWLIEAVDDDAWAALLQRARAIALTELRSAPHATEAPSIDNDPDLSHWVPAAGARTITPPPSVRSLPPPRVGAFERLTGHPPGLAILFMTEMWERFSFYGMKGLLKSYMMFYLFVEARRAFHDPENPNPTIVQGDPSAVLGWAQIRDTFGISGYEIQGQASLIYGTYVGLVYMTPLIGGIVADRWLGRKYTVIIGAILMAIGHFVMAFDNLFFVALLLLIIGNGAFKPNISTQVGNLYAEGDPRRDRAFSTFYVGINLGAFISNFVCGALALAYGWHYGFGAAGIGMLIGLVVYVLGQPLLGADTPPAAAAPTAAEDTRGPLSRDEWMIVGALVLLAALNVVYWGVYEQQGNTMQTWADTQTEWPTVAGYQIPTTLFQSFNPGMIFLFTPFVNMFWAWQQSRNAEPSSVTKMAIGTVLLGISYLAMAGGALLIGDGKGSLFWPVVATGLLTIGELYLSPIGLSLVSKVSPKRIVSMMMGMWFMSSFLGGFIAGWLGTLYDAMSKPAFFAMCGVLGLLTAAAMAVFNRPLKNILGHNI